MMRRAEVVVDTSGDGMGDETGVVVDTVAMWWMEELVYIYDTCMVSYINYPYRAWHLLTYRGCCVHYVSLLYL
jgi:hypothetical protein